MANNLVSVLLASDIADPTDFPPASAAPGLRDLDGALRCTICSELFEAPVTLPCGHCFCSMCIRAALGEKQECPSCRKSCNEGLLRVNPAMEETVVAWKTARPFLLRLSKEEERRATGPDSGRTAKRRRRERSRASDASGEGVLPLAPPSISGIDDGRIVDGLGKIAVHDAVDSLAEEEGSIVDEMSIVICPACSQNVQFKKINKHIDLGCPRELDAGALSNVKAKNAWSNLLGPSSSKGKEREALPDPSPLPKASYAILKEKQLKDLLSEHGLPLNGDRRMLSLRHERWVMLYNANLDRSPVQRQSLADLRKALKKWEAGLTRNGKNDIIDLDKYQRANRTNFKQLIEAARPKINSSTCDSVSARAPEVPAPVEDVISILDSEEERAPV